MRIKKILLKIIMIFCVITIIFNVICQALPNNLDNKKILILASYSVGDTWERDIIKGVKDKLGEDAIVKIEFLDSKASKTKEYDKSFMNLLNLKYGKDIDYILVLDDEAFDIARENLFNEDLFTYKKPIIFVGVNNYVALSDEENHYITGVLEYQNNLLMINTILKINKNIENIYLLLDNSIYSTTIAEDFKSLVNQSDRQYNTYIFRGNYFEDIKEKCRNINKKNSAIVLCATYKNKKSGEIISPQKTINEIKNITTAPIYTKLEQYIDAGAVGGIINDGYKLGIVAGKILMSVAYGNNIHEMIPPHDTFDIPKFNFASIREYNINPLKLPENSIFIKKKFYNLIVPKYMEIIIWMAMILTIITIILLIYLFNFNKRKAKEKQLLLIESMERERIRTDFIVTISHELRTPLNIIINATNLLKIKLDNNDIDKEFFYKRLEFIMKNANRLRRYINNLIDVNKLELGYFSKNFSNENIVSIVENVTLNIVDLAKKFNIEVIFDTEEEEIITAVDKVKIERIILNLLSNAIKFTNDNGTIMVLVRREKTNVIIEVSDNGIGMSEDMKKHIFEKFKREDLNGGLDRQNEGSGLGLFIVKGLVELHNGSISVESEINKGSKFIISIPILIEADSNDNRLIGETSLEYLSDIELSDIDKK